MHGPPMLLYTRIPQRQIKLEIKINNYNYILRL